ncbi:23S rRNA (adenine(2030)-N(6))-methyltransferase RlmJ [Ruegeria sp. EL01]|jgi:23S rRNA (adenine2030-N6)-methyltransferase|uniref:23S rRNA (adenine(2030)-N(6))-methyltransferase RlmJ n=1 Tax=Ruegeria sp. EL01 TaxID=2107578 RepID=UPI000EA82787|nr:23S rRNA (adenine(2030)-N(6))-methyltransferase RlmJ [Ruegeria sp. EL01]
MLSYQHIYHAGNLADVQKHTLLAWALSYLTQKDKPLSYVETHAGRGLYRLDSDEALKTGEAAAGIERVQREDWFEANHPLACAISAAQSRFGGACYPGSPLIATNLLRPQDSLHFAELHPQEHAALEQVLTSGNAKAYKQDGYELAQSLLPPTPRRGMLLIDPSYEMKSEYDRLPGIINKLHRKWNVGVIALWYPILTDNRHLKMNSEFNNLHLPRLLHHEVTFPAARQGHGMIGSGMLIVNAPFGLEEEANRLSELFEKI